MNNLGLQNTFNTANAGFNVSISNTFGTSNHFTGQNSTSNFSQYGFPTPPPSNQNNPNFWNNNNMGGGMNGGGDFKGNGFPGNNNMMGGGGIPPPVSGLWTWKLKNDTMEGLGRIPGMLHLHNKKYIIIFNLDASGSMGGNSWETVCECVQIF